MLLVTFSFRKSGVEWVRIGPALKDRPQRSGKANEKLHAIKKKLGLPSAGPRPFTGHLRSHDGICWTNEDWWSWMWKSPDWRPGLARLTDCWGHCSLLILSLHGPMISKSEMRKIHGVSVMYCYFIFLISFQIRTAQREQLTLCYFIHYWLTATFLKSKAKLKTFDFNLLILLDYNLNLQLKIWTYNFNLKLSK